jgi:two-component system OmpR family sensor kinase
VKLRTRLVVGLVALLVVGLALFGVATYSLYSRSEYQRLDDQLRAAEPAVTRQLVQAANQNGNDGDRNDPFGSFGPGPAGRGNGGPAAPIPLSVYAELRDSSNHVLSHRVSDSVVPELPAELPSPGANGKFLTVGSQSGSTQFRVLVRRTQGPDAELVAVAVPMTEVVNALHRLIAVETSVSILLLLALVIGSWYVLRRGLLPLEHMAATARTINAGDLSQRVSPSGGPTEVGELGLALNSMLDDIEAAFREREATERKLRQFLSDASHELRTPLTSILGFAELFRVSGEDARVDLPTILRRIEEESARMKGLVEDLLLLARLDETRPVERKPVDLTILAADACSDAVATAPDHPVTLDAPEPVVVAGDEGHLRQAIGNLVSNAVRHTPPGTPVEVAARIVGGQAVVTVRDHGSGLDDDALAHVFDRFWQADQARVGTGAGLGLAIVAGITTEHGGTVEVENVVDGGARFTIHLPLDPAAR